MTTRRRTDLSTPQQVQAERRMRWALIGFALFTLAAMASPASRALVVVFPAISFALGIYFAPRSMRLYLTLVAWLYMLTPMVRRVAEWHSGASSLTFLMSAPPLAAVAGLVIYRREWSALLRRMPRPWIFMLMALVYALLVGILSHGVKSVLPDVLGWFGPLCFALFIIAHRDRTPEMVSALRTNFLVGVLVTGLYGLYQFFFLAPWDAYWMEMSNLTSIGFPAPMQVRVFSTMNTPQPFADFLIFGLLLSLTSTKWLRFLVVPIGVLVLGLTMSRSAWIAGVLSMGYIVFTLTARQRLQIVAVLAGCVVVVGIAAIVPEINEILTQRLQTLNNLKDDGSVTDRVQSEREAVQMFLSTPFGLGLGADTGLRIDGPSYGRAQLNEVTISDNGVEELLLTMGWFASIVYLVGFGDSLLSSFRSAGRETAIPRAMIVALLIQIPVLGIFPGASGFLLWTSLALCYGATSTAQTARPRHRIEPALLGRGELEMG